MQRGWVVSPDYHSAIETTKAAREGLGISQRELARRLEKHPSFVNKIEKLERRLDVLEFIAIAEAMEIDCARLLSDIRERLPAKIEI
jgi:ribosome-binding protein aMBF1 (putative translation factor)